LQMQCAASTTFPLCVSGAVRCEKAALNKTVMIDCAVSRVGRRVRLR
jgi:hypothetical protein